LSESEIEKLGYLYESKDEPIISGSNFLDVFQVREVNINFDNETLHIVDDTPFSGEVQYLLQSDYNEWIVIVFPIKVVSRENVYFEGFLKKLENYQLRPTNALEVCLTDILPDIYSGEYYRYTSILETTKCVDTNGPMYIDWSVFLNTINVSESQVISFYILI
jgi:carbonic anhydrase